MGSKIDYEPPWSSEHNHGLASPAATAVSDSSPRVVMQVLSAFFVFFNTWGLLLAFGALQTYYEQDLLSSKSSSAISWISTTSAFLLLVSGLVTGPLYDHGYLRALLVGGSLLEILGFMMMSLAREYYQVFLAQAVCLGLCGGMVYVPSIAAAAASIGEAKRPLVIGVVASGSGIGGVIYPVVFRQLEPQVGFPWTVRIMAFVALFAFLPSYAMLPLKPSKSPEVRRFINPTAFKDVPFILFVLAGFFGAVGYYIPLIYLPIYAETAANFTNTSLAFYLLAIINGTSTVGRIVAGTIAGPVTTVALGIGCCGILLFSWTAVHTVAGLIVWLVIWGLVSSIIVSLPGAIIPILSPSMGVLGTRNGMYWAGSAVGVLIGSPIAGTLVASSSSGVVWWRLQVFAGLSMVVGTVLVIYPAIYAARRRRS